jgi:hypothetical protein
MSAERLLLRLGTVEPMAYEAVRVQGNRPLLWLVSPATITARLQPLSRQNHGAAARNVGEGKPLATMAMAEISELHAQNLQLHSTIGQLRNALEVAAAQTQTEVQSARAAMAQDIADLKDTVQALRDGLDSQAIASEAALQVLRAAHAAETDQLRATVNALRLQLDSANADAAQSLRSQEAQAHRDQEILKEHIKLLRIQLETNA